MKKAILGGLLLATFALVSMADVVKLKPDHPDTYTVKKGDTLWDISGMFLRDPWLWPEIWQVNPQVDNPHLIYPGDVLNLVYIDGRPKLVVKRGGDVKLSPTVKSTPLDLAIPAISLDAIGPFLSNSRVLAGEDLESAPYVLTGKGGHIIAGAGDQLYARGQFKDAKEAYRIYRPGDAYIDPQTNELLGYEAQFIAAAKINSIKGDVATMQLDQTAQEVRRGDRLLPSEQRRIISKFFPSAADPETNGYIISVDGGVAQIGAMDVVTINRGAREGVVVGNVMSIYQAGPVVRDEVANQLVRIPDTRAGLLMVFRVFEKVSYGIVLKSSEPIRVGDKVFKP